MSWGRVISSAAAVVAVAAAAAVAVGMSHADAGSDGGGAATPFVMPSLTHATYSAPAPAASTTPAMSAAATAASTAASTAAAQPATTRAAASRSASSPRPAVTPKPRSTPAALTHAAPAPVRPKTTAAPKPAAVTGSRLPLRYPTGSASRVITVVAHSTRGTVATLQAWDRVSGGWRRHGGSVTAHIGSQGMSSSPSESRSATPIGTFTLTQAFGYYSNPGTGLPYFKTTAADWWISQAGPLYNTHQHCSGRCGFTQGDPNEHLAYETPYYNYAVVIDYNTRNSPTGVRQGAGSAFFLHVTDGRATAGCIAIPQSTLVSIMRWLAPSTHPRILIGVA